MSKQGKGKRGIALTNGETITLLSAAARTASANTGASDGWEYIGGERGKIVIILDITASATDAGDTLDVYIDLSLTGTQVDGIAVRFTQQAGNGSANRQMAILNDAVSFGTSVIPVSSAPGSGAVRPGMIGAPYIRARAVLADSGDGNTSHTFSVTAYAI